MIEKIFFRWASYMLIWIRGLLSLHAIWSDTSVGWLLGAYGLWQVYSTCVAWRYGKPDLSWSGLFVGSSYLLPLLFSFNVPAWPFWASAFWAMVAVGFAIRVVLGYCCTVSAPVFVEVVDFGPYRIVRHPMNLSDLITAMVVALLYPCWWNAGVFGLVAIGKMVTILLEEKFLLSEPAYQAYASRVVWRLLPGVW